MRIWLRNWTRVIGVTLGLLAPLAIMSRVAMADALDTTLSYESIEPSRIKLGDSAQIRVTTLYGTLKSVPLPTVPGLTFELIGRSQGLDFVGGKSLPATFILIRVTPQFAGVFTIPGLIPQAKPLGLEVVTGDEPNPYAFHNPNLPQPKPVARAPIPKGVQLKAGGAVFVQLVIPKRAVYVGESVPVDIEVGVRPGIVTSFNGLPTLNSSDFTLNDLSKQPIRREQVIDGSPFEILTWHTILGAVKPGAFSLSVEAPLSVRDARSAEDTAIASKLGWPFSQIIYNGVAPKDVKVPSPAVELKVLPLPTQEQPKDFSGAVGDFQVTSDISPANAAVGEPQTLRLHIKGAGSFDRVNSTLLDHLEHWKTYPVKSAFTPSNTLGYSGEKIFEQPLIAEASGEQIIPELELSYFNPETQHYERARTLPIKVTIADSLADSSAGALAAAGSLGSGASTRPLARGLRPDHPQSQDAVSELRPLYFQSWFLAVPTALALLLAGSWLAVRPNTVRATSKAAQRALAQLDAAARSGDSYSFFAGAKQALLQTFTAQWRMSPEAITADELKARLGSAGEEIERLFALADEAQYADYKPGEVDFQRWLALIRGQLTGAGE